MQGNVRIRHMLITSSHDAFHGLTSGILSGLLPNIADTKRLGDLDREGIDAYQYETKTLTHTAVYQFKGFEKPAFEKKQLDQCLKEIAKYKKKGPNTNNYWLVLNRNVTDRTHRKQIIAALDDLVKSDKATTATLLDLEKLIAELVKLASIRVEELANEKRRKLIADYRSKLEFVDYIEDVPFLADGNRINPSRYLLRSAESFFANLPPDTAGKNRKARRYLLSSEFGFGKTSTLHAVAAQWHSSGGHAIYAPAALLGNLAFANGAGLIDALLEFLIPEDAEVSTPVRLLLRYSFRRDVARSMNWILLIDGMDENSNAMDHGRITAFWNGVNDLGIPSVISVRSELSELRAVEFGVKDSEFGDRFLEHLKLTDWSDKEVLRFLKTYAARKGGDTPAVFANFVGLVERGSYKHVYGDIPRRPLFLGMLAEDAWSGSEPERTIHRLYGKYFRKKFKFDRFSQAAQGIVSRDSKIVDQHGVEEACERVILTMQNAAERLAISQDLGDHGAGDKYQVLVLNDTISEALLAEAASKAGVPDVRSEEMVLHSLLQPAGRDLVTRERLFRFSHRSYQEWFTARHFAATGYGAVAAMPPEVAKFFGPMSDDMKNGLPLP